MLTPRRPAKRPEKPKAEEKKNPLHGLLDGAADLVHKIVLKMLHRCPGLLCRPNPEFLMS